MVSVIIPTFNRAGFLKKAIESVFSQTFQDFELIVVDDGSTDKTREILEENFQLQTSNPRVYTNIKSQTSNFQTNSPPSARPRCTRLSAKSMEAAGKHQTSKIRYIYQNNKGPAAARNLGIRESKGDFIAFLDSDDRWHKEKLAIQCPVMKKNPDFLVAHTQEVWYKNGRLLNQKKKHRKFHGDIFEKCLPLCAVGPSTAMIKRELFDLVGFFDESFPCCEDYEFWLRVSIKHNFFLIDKALTFKEGGRKDQVSYIYRTGMDKFRIKALVKALDSGFLNDRQKELVKNELRRKCQIYGNGCIKHGKREEGRHYLTLSLK